MAQEDDIVRLARQIDAARTAERFLVNATEVANLRRQGACELHRICAQFVSSVNSNLSEPALALSPTTYERGSFRESGMNLVHIQIDSQGRQMQIAFETPSTPVSTEKFLVPYVLEGELRTYNQKMLDRFEIRSLLLFFCVKAGTADWRFFDWRSSHTGPVDQELLAREVQRLF